MKAETKILIYKLVLVVKIYVLGLQKNLKTWGDKSASPPGTQRVKVQFYSLVSFFESPIYHSVNPVMREEYLICEDYCINKGQ